MVFNAIIFLRKIDFCVVSLGMYVKGQAGIEQKLGTDRFEYDSKDVIPKVNQKR